MFRGLGLEDPGLGLEGWSHGFEDPGLVLEGWSHGFEDPGLGLKGWGLGLKTLALTTSVTVTCPRLADGVSEACSRRLELRRLGCIHVGGTGISWIFGRPDLLKAKIKFSTFDAVLLAQVSRLSLITRPRTLTWFLTVSCLGDCCLPLMFLQPTSAEVSQELLD